MVSLLLPLLLAIPTAERCAAMLLSPNEEMRRAGAAALEKVDRDAVLRILARRAHSRPAWIADLEKQLEDSQGPRHTEIRELLRILKNSTEDNIGVDVVLIALPPASARGLLGDGLPRVAFRRADAWPRWWGEVAKAKGAAQLLKASMAGKDALDVAVERKRQVSYVSDFVMEGNIGSPVIEQLEEGLFVEWRPVLSRDGEHVTLEFDLKTRHLKRPIAAKEKLVGGVKARIQVPEVTERKKRVSLTLPLGGCGAFPFVVEEDEVVVVFARARIGAPQGVPDLPIPVRDE